MPYDPYETQNNLDAFQRQYLNDLQQQQVGGGFHSQSPNIDWASALIAGVLGFIFGRRF